MCWRKLMVCLYWLHFLHCLPQWIPTLHGFPIPQRHVHRCKCLQANSNVNQKLIVDSIVLIFLLFQHFHYPNSILATFSKGLENTSLYQYLDKSRKPIKSIKTINQTYFFSLHQSFQPNHSKCKSPVISN